MRNRSFWGVLLVGLIAGCAQDSVGPVSETGPGNVLNGPSFTVTRGNTADLGSAYYQGIAGQQGWAAAIQQAVNNAGTVHIPAGDYTLTGVVYLPSGTRVYGDGPGATRLRPTAAVTDVFRANGTTSAHVTDIVIEQLGFIGVNQMQWALRVLRARTVYFQNNRADGMFLFRSEEPTPYSSTTMQALSSDLHVRDNTGVGPTTTNIAAIEFRYARDAWAERNSITNYGNGILWWGGDSDITRDGNQPGKPKWARSVNILNNNVRQIGYNGAGFAGGGIWGSMGDTVMVRGNTVSDCADYCAGGEGTDNLTIWENNVSNGLHSALRVFAYSKNVTFGWNQVSQPGNGRDTLFYTSNASRAESQVSIRLHNNTFTYTGATGVGVIDKEFSEYLLFANNTLSNVALRMDGCAGLCQWNGYVEITGNTFDFSHSAGGPALYVAHNWNRGTWIAGNQIRSSVSQPGEAIKVVQSQTPSITSRIFTNTIRGFTGSRSVYLQGVGTFHLENNSSSGGLYAPGVNLLKTGYNNWYVGSGGGGGDPPPCGPGIAC